MSFHGNVVKMAKENSFFRKVLYTGEHAQLVIMSLKVAEDIGMETHSDVDQILFFVEGNGKAVLNGVESEFVPGDAVFVPAGTEHNFINTGSSELKLYTVYSPPEHPDGTIHETKPVKAE